MEYVDLHIHSFKSDGTWKPSEIEKEAKRLGMKAFAISDHDTVAGVLECEKCVPAIEMGTTFDNKDLHLLGYFIDVGDARLLREIDKQKINRERRVYDTLEAAEKHDIFITIEDVRKEAGGESIGKPHIARAVAKYMGISTCGVEFDIFYAENFKKGGKLYVEREKITTTKAIEVLDNAGGIPVLAHPADAGVDELLPYLIRKGMAGIEVFYPYRASAKQKIEHYMTLATKMGILMTGGSDSHGPGSSKDVPLAAVKVPIDVYNRLLEYKEGL